MKSFNIYLNESDNFINDNIYVFIINSVDEFKSIQTKLFNLRIYWCTGNKKVSVTAEELEMENEPEYPLYVILNKNNNEFFYRDFNDLDEYDIYKKYSLYNFDYILNIRPNYKPKKINRSYENLNEMKYFRDNQEITEYISNKNIPNVNFKIGDKIELDIINIRKNFNKEILNYELDDYELLNKDKNIQIVQKFYGVEWWSRLDSIYLKDISINSGIFWIQDKYIKANTPNYKPKKFDRTLESLRNIDFLKNNLKNGMYNTLNFKVENVDDKRIISEFLEKIDIEDANKPGYSSNRCFTIFVDVVDSFPLFKVLSSGNGDHMEDGSFIISYSSAKISPIMSVSEFINYINKFDIPNYRPKKFDRTLESLNESPDNFKFNGKTYNVRTRNAFAFEVKINKKGEIKNVMINPAPGYHMDYDETTGGKDRIYPGRIFIDQKILTFWTYPTKEELDIIIPVMERKLNIKIYNNDWLVEVYLDESGNPYGMGDRTLDSKYDRYNDLNKFIPVEDYTGSLDIPKEEREDHTKLPLFKTRKAGPTTFGSNRYAEKLPLIKRQELFTESVHNKYLPYSIWCDTRKKALECEEYFHSLGYFWSDRSKYIIKKYSDIHAFLFTLLDFENKTFDGYDNFQSYPEKKLLNYPEDFNKITSLMKYGIVRPNYNPKKFNKTFESFQKLNETNFIFFASNDKLEQFEFISKFKIGEEVLIKTNGHFIHKNNGCFSEDDKVIEWIKSNEFKKGLINEVTFEANGRKWFYEISIDDRKEWVVEDALSVLKPNYRPKKFNRTLESFEKLNETNYFFIKNNIEIDNFVTNKNIKQPKFKIGDTVILKWNALNIHLGRIDFQLQQPRIKWIENNINKSGIIKEIAYGEQGNIWFYEIEIEDNEDWLVEEAIESGLKPNYNPKKFNRTLESFSDMYEYVVFKMNNEKESEYIQNYLFDLGYQWEYEFQNKNTKKFRAYPMYLFVAKDDIYLTHMGSINNTVEYVLKYITEQNNNNEKICPILFKPDDVKYLDAIFKTGNIRPSYKPKKFDRTL
jgi:hypothetical protein